MNDDSHSKKLNYQLQQMAFQKYPYQINNKTFFCLQTYYQDQLLNGVDLQLKQAKGISAQPQKIAYLQQNQQIIMFIGSNIVSYNAQKRAYSLITEVNGYVQILRTYTSKLSNKTFIYWLQCDKQGQNIKKTVESKGKMNSNTDENGKRQNNKKKITSILDFGKLIGLSADIKEDDKIVEQSLQSGVIQVQQRKEQEKKVRFNQNEKQKQNTQNQQKSLKKHNHKPSQKQKETKKVRIQAPLQEQEQQQKTDRQMKKFSICIYDYENKLFLHRQNLQIDLHEVINEIFIYFMTQKMVGYVINDQADQRAKIFYIKIKIDELITNSKLSTRKLLQKKKKLTYNKRCERFNIINSIMEVPLLKYNGETDQYLFKDINTVYSLQVYQLEHQIVVNNEKSRHEQDIKKKRLKESIRKQKDNSRQQSNKKQDNVQESKRKSIQIMNGFDIDSLSKEIQQIAIKMKNTLIDQEQLRPRDKYSIRVTEQIQISAQQNIIDIALSEVYLVVLTNECIRFYSIFNLNTLLFKSQIHNIKQLPPPTNVELNKSYLLMTHQNSVLVSSYSILERKLKYNSTCEVEIEHCQSILKLYMNTYNCEVALLARQFEIQGRMTNLLKSKRVITSPITSYKKTFLDISFAYINFSSTKCETQQLYLKNQRFKNILVCKWHAQYLIQTQNQIITKQWRQSFENMRCSCIHPTGQYLIIGFADCFKIYALTQEGLQNTFMTDVLKDCQSITYSEYGDQFAIGSANNIAIYGSYDCGKRYTILLSVGSIVQNLQYRGYNLICTLKSKKVIVYHSQLNYKQIFSFNPKQYLNQNKHQLNIKSGQSAQNLMKLTIKRVISIEIYSLFYDLQLNVLIFSSGQKIFFLNTLTNQSLGNYQFPPISTMEYNKHLSTLFIGTFTGQLIAFPWPNNPSNILSQLPKFTFHSSKIIKIKITSDFKYLISIGADMAIYKSCTNYILNLKRLKGSEIAQYKSSKSAIAYCNFLNSKGICQFSHSQNTQKLEEKKQLQQEVVNTVFMLPEERMKQKQNLVDKLTLTKDQLNDQNIKQFQPLQEESIGLRNKIYQIKDQIINLKRLSSFAIENQKKQHQQKTSNLLNKYSEMNYQKRLLQLQFKEQIQQIQNQNQKQYENFKQQNSLKQNQLLKQIQSKQIHSENQKNNFLQLDLIDQEKQSFIKKQLESFQNQIQITNSKNGQLSCKNSTVQKQISVLKYRIEELKFVSMNANYSIESLQGKQKKQKQEKLVFQNLLLQNAKINVSEMEKKYIKATKQLIEKNKLIDINLVLYEKEKEILVKLQKTVQKTESEIDRIVESFQQQKDFRRYLIQKCTFSKQRLKQFTQLRNSKNLKRNKGRVDLRNFLNELHQLEKELQSCLQENRRQKTNQTQEVMKRLRQLDQFGNKKQSLKKQEKLVGESDKSLKRKEERIKTEVIQQEGFKRKESSKKSNAYFEIMSNLKKSSSNFMKQKKQKKLRFSTEQRSVNFMSKDEFLSKINKQGKEKQVFKIQHKKKFQQQFGKYRKDNLLNNTITGKFKQTTQRQQPQTTKLLQKTNSKYYNMKTEGNLKNEGNFKTQRFSNNSIANNNSPSSKRGEIPSNTYRDINTIVNDVDSQRIIQRQKHSVIKKLTTEDKLVNKINNDKKLFMTSKTRLNQQNQDLLNTYNSLTHQNKYYQNLIKVYQTTINDQSQHYRLNAPHSQQSPRHFFSSITDSINQHSKSNTKLNQTYTSKIHTSSQDKIKQTDKKLTPFDQYIKNKQTKFDHLKKKNFQQTQNKNTFQQLVPNLTKVKKPQTSQQKRVKTVPCVQFNF